ncbi:sugar kinase [Metabacillus malikii]|uniref:2-dehydro-3-deoxygluconokinase n=1 Tax=Metabacillus malikii TaxID=1504265 RepID=A0ABT9ZAI6_9BACI|nr:sugar kinase [Metabacillus malikii]MDQ0229253.1 2-dehydro-3-deoxygluconokinase [Metabacillus malikii]
MDVVTIGESMVVFTPTSDGFMRNASQFTKKIGGAESNVAVGLARLGHKAGWISKLGDDEFGKAILGFLKSENIDVSNVSIDEEAPTGIYFKEPRRQNHMRVYYYRKGSAASKLTPFDLNQEYIASAKYLHITGITPALSESCKETIFEAIKLAKRHGRTVVFDPNLRLKLWDEATARATLLEIASEADIVLPGIAEGEFLFGERDPEKLGQLFLNHGASLVVMKNGAEGAFYFTEKESALIPGFPVKHVVDPVGAGDGFAAGFLSGLLDGLEVGKAVERANAVGALVTMVTGDVDGLPERDELEQLLSKNEEDVVR